MPYTIHKWTVHTETTNIEDRVNLYLLNSERQGILIDAGFHETSSGIYLQLMQTEVQLQGIYLTHFHPDHSMGAIELAKRTGCIIHCHPNEYPKLIELYRNHSKMNDLNVIEADLIHGSTIHFADEVLQIIHTPGHTHGHIAIIDKKQGFLFSGDTVIEGGTVWIGPPDGHLIDYLHSLSLISQIPVQKLFPGHGNIIEHPDSLIEYMKNRRKEREQEILELISIQDETINSIVQQIYANKISDTALWAAKKTVTAHLQKLLKENRICMYYNNQAKKFLYKKCNSV